MESIQQLLIVILVLSVLAGVLWTLQKRGLVRFAPAGMGSRNDRKLRLIERLQLSPHHSLCLIQLDGQTLLIGTAPSSCTLLNPEEPR